MTTMTTSPAATVMTTGAELRKAIAWVQPGTHPGRPVLGCVRVTVAAGRLILSSFDCETIRLADLPLGADTGLASVLVDGAALGKLAGAGPGGRKPVEVAVVTSAVDLTAAPGTGQAERLTLAAADPAGYPALPPVPGAAAATGAEAFTAAAARVTPMVSAEKELPWLQAIRIQADGRLVTLSATDRYRIGLEHVPADVTAAAADVLFPGRLAARFAAAADGPAVYLLDDGGQWAGLTDTRWTVITRRIAGEPVNLARYLAGLAAPAVTLTVDAQALAAVLGSAAAIKPVKKDADEFAFTEMTAVPGKGLQLRLARGETAWTAEFGAVRQDGAELMAAFKPAMLASLLAGLPGDAEIGLITAKKSRLVTTITVTAGAVPGFTGAAAGVDPSKVKT